LAPTIKKKAPAVVDVPKAKAQTSIVPAVAPPTPVSSLAKHVVVTIPSTNDHTEAHIAGVNETLESLAIGAIAQGPDIKSILARLELPKITVPMESVQDKATSLEIKLNQANEDVGKAHTISSQLHEMAIKFRDQISTELDACKSNMDISASSSTSLSFAALDQRRAAIVASHASWETRARDKRSEVWEAVNLACSAAEDTISLLRSQQKELNARHLAHREAWEKINAQKQAKMQNEIAKMVERCEAAKTILNVPEERGHLAKSSIAASGEHVETDITKLQAQVAGLIAQLAKFGVTPAVQPITITTGIESVGLNTGQTDGTVIDSSGDSPMQNQDTVDKNESVLVPTMSSVVDQTVAQPDALASTDGCKGKGKGKDDKHGNY